MEQLGYGITSLMSCHCFQSGTQERGESSRPTKHHINDGVSETHRKHHHLPPSPYVFNMRESKKPCGKELIFAPHNVMI